MSKIQFNEVSTEEVSGHINTWTSQLLTPHDDMWWSFCLGALTLDIRCDHQSIGFASINEEGQLIRFYVKDLFLDQVSRIMRSMKEQSLFTTAIIGTHDTASMHAVSSLGAQVATHTLLYELMDQDQIKSCDSLSKATAADLDRIVAYYHHAIQAPVDWLKMYVGERIEKQEFYFLEDQDTIVGSCEVRQHSYSKAHASIGIAVNPDYRKKGLGTKLLGAAAQMALDSDRNPICSTEVDNLGSIKAIEANGLKSKYQLIKYDF